jgi:UDP-N-acetylglucosamine--N-acetylmuramyl-(pentapeptide) pyrophosphoryl-undecaprenol N-acetylglucosamine transferase
VVHQTGALNRDGVRDAYRAAGLEPDAAQAEVLPFIDDMAAPGRLRPDAVPRRRRHRERAVRGRRARGAGAADRGQHHRAPARQRAADGAHGAALHLPQAELTPERWPDCCRGWTARRCWPWPAKARALARPRAAARVADEIERLVKP